MYTQLRFALLLLIGIIWLLHRLLSNRDAKPSAKSSPPVFEPSPPGSRKRYIDNANSEIKRLQPHIDKCLSQPRSLEVLQRLEGFIKRLLAVHFERAVALSTSPQQFSEELQKAQTLQVFEQYLALFREFPADERIQLVSGSYLNEVAIEFVAIPLLLGRTELAQEYSALAVPCLWCVEFENEEGRALVALISHQPYKKSDLGDVRGVWRHQVLYLDLIEAITNSRSYDSELESVRSSFNKLTTSKRNKNFDFLDPSGYHELDWDCRLSYIFEAIHQCGWKEQQPDV